MLQKTGGTLNFQSDLGTKQIEDTIRSKREGSRGQISRWFAKRGVSQSKYPYVSHTPPPGSNKKRKEVRQGVFELRTEVFNQIFIGNPSQKRAWEA